jgi:hypothetical protein
MCKLGQAFFGQLQLRQYPLGASPRRVFTFPKPVAPARFGMCMRPSPSLAAGLPQLASMPDGRVYLWVARCIQKVGIFAA